MSANKWCGDRDHMHSWELSDEWGWECVTEPRDNPAPLDISSLSRGQVGDNKLHLYGTMTNYNLVMQHKPQQRA